MRYSIIIVLSYLIGIIWGLYQESLGIVPVFLFLVTLIILVLNLKTENKLSLNYKVIFLVISFIILGFVNYGFRKDRFKNIYKNGNINVEGEIINLIKQGEINNKYILKSKAGEKFLVYLNNELGIKEGDILNISGKFENPSEARNKGGFDYAKYLYSQNIYGSIFVYNDSNIEFVRTFK